MSQILTSFVWRKKTARIQFTTCPVRLSDVLHILISSMAVCLKAVASAAPMVSASKVLALALMAEALVLRCWPRLPHWCMLVVNTRFCSKYYYIINVAIFTYCCLTAICYVRDTFQMIVFVSGLEMKYFHISARMKSHTVSLDRIPLYCM